MSDPKFKWRRPRPQGGLYRFGMVVFVLTAVGLPLATPLGGHLSAVGNARAAGSIFGSPVIAGKLSPHGNFVELVQSELGSFTPVSDGDTVFANDIQIYIFNTHPVNETVQIQFVQNTTPRNSYANASVYAGSLALIEYDLILPTSIAQVNAVINVDGATWHVLHLTPLTLLPPSIANAGGLDLVILAILAEALILMAPLTLLAKRIVTKTKYAPKFNLVVWAHVILIGVLTFVFADYRAVDAIMGGTSFFVYPVIVAMLFFLWSLHLFNEATVVEILKPDTMEGHRLRYLRWTQLIAVLKDGRTVVIDTRWRGFLYAMFGHFATLIPVASEATIEGRPASATIDNRRAIPRAVREKRLRRVRPGKERPEDDFEIINAEKEGEPTKIFWVDSDQPVDVRFPFLSFYKWVDVPRKVDKSGNVIEEAHRKRKLTWPHIEEPTSDIRLAGIHYFDTPLAALGWSSAEDSFGLLEKRAYQVYVLRSRLHTEADRMTEERVAELFHLLESGEMPLTDEEAADEAERRFLPRDLDRYSGDRGDLRRLREDDLRAEEARRRRKER